MRRFYCMVLLIIIVSLPPQLIAERSGIHSVTLVEDDRRRSIKTDAGTVAELIREQGLRRAYDRVFPDPSSEIIDGTHVFLYSLDQQPTSRKRTVNSESIEVHSRALPEGRHLVIRGSKDGLKRGNDWIQKPVHRLILEGQTAYKNNRIVELREHGTLSMLATGYSPHRLDTAPYDDGNSALGLPAGYGIVAVDPQFIPLGTRLYVEGYGYAIAADVGGDIEGKRIDLGFPNRRDALLFGRRWLKVNILE